MKKLFTLLLGFLLLSGCTKEEKKQDQPKREYTYPTIELKSNPTTGYQWYLELSEEGIVSIQKYYEADKTDELLDGAGGKDIFEIMPLKAGKVKLQLTYCQSLDDSIDGKDIIVYEIIVDEQNTITINEL